MDGGILEAVAKEIKRKWSEHKIKEELAKCLIAFKFHQMWNIKVMWATGGRGCRP